MVNLSPDHKLERRQAYASSIENFALSSIEDAQSKGQLTIPAHMDIQQVSFATWAQNYGTISLLSSEVDQCSGSTGLAVERELVNSSNLLFDGLAWAPLSKDRNYAQSVELALQKVFPSELALLKSMGREFSFAEQHKS